MKKKTIYDIASEAGVSPSTVSRILTGSANVRAEKRARVEKVLKKYDFRPSNTARSLKTRRSRKIGCVVPDIINPYFSTLFYEFERLFSENGYNVILCNSDSIRKKELELMRMLIDENVEAIVFMGGIVDDMHPLSKHLKLFEQYAKLVPVIVTSQMPDMKCTQVYADEKNGIYQIVEHLYERGHKTLGMIGGGLSVRQAVNRRQYLVEASERYGIEIRSEWLIEGGYSLDSGIICINKLLSLDKRPTAIFAFSDYVALGALYAMNQNSVKVPQDMALVGFDGVLFSQITYPGITTVRVDFQSFAEKLLYIVKNATWHKHECYQIGMKLISRGTT